MRHRVGQRKLGRVTEHRIAMLRNQAEALIRHERIETTLPKAKELRPFVERIITIAKRGLAAATPTPARCTRGGWCCATSRTATSSRKLFDTIAPRFEARPGGYTRILRARLPPRRQRRGRADRAGRQRVQPERREPRRPRAAGGSRSRRASAAACARRPIACAASRRRKAKRAKAPKAPTTKKAKPAARRTRQGRQGRHARQGRQDLAPRKAGGS